MFCCLNSYKVFPLLNNWWTIPRRRLDPLFAERRRIYWMKNGRLSKLSHHGWMTTESFINTALGEYLFYSSEQHTKHLQWKASTKHISVNSAKKVTFEDNWKIRAKNFITKTGLDFHVESAIREWRAAWIVSGLDSLKHCLRNNFECAYRANEVSHSLEIMNCFVCWCKLNYAHILGWAFICDKLAYVQVVTDCRYTVA